MLHIFHITQGEVRKKFAERMLIWCVPKMPAYKFFQRSCKFFPWCIKVKQFYLKCCWNVAAENILLKYSLKTLFHHSHPYLTQIIHIAYDSQERLKCSKAFYVSSSSSTPPGGKIMNCYHKISIKWWHTWWALLTYFAHFYTSCNSSLLPFSRNHAAES